TALDKLGNESGPSGTVTAAPSGPVAWGQAGQFLNGPNSVWSTPLPASAPVDPDTSVMMRGVDAAGTTVAGAQGGLMASAASVGTQFSYLSYSSPLYVVGPGQPRVPMRITPVLSHHGPLIQALSGGVPIPPSAQSGAGSDGHMTVYQPSSDTLWEFWRACSPFGPNNFGGQSPQRCPATPDRTWTAQYGGVMTNVSSTGGYFDDQSFPGLSGWYWGATATSLPISAGMVTMEELKSGHIDHALALNIPGYGNPGAVCAYTWWRSPNGMGPRPIAWPAQRSDGTYLGPDCIPEGSRLRIDPNFDLNSISMPKVARMYAVAAQKYGMIVRDRAAAGLQFFAEDPISLKQQGEPLNPYTDLPWGNNGSAPKASGLLQGNPTWSMFKTFPWSKVQVLSGAICHQHPPGPCPQQGN
ncbi:MAG: hypothetical protein QOH46_2842, partial [Solirubrobacteraceae bacterium]|nr:hypothetical protein [Solirubrobacteraceae bacterium]